jgi:hypothetical protein
LPGWFWGLVKMNSKPLKIGDKVTHAYSNHIYVIDSIGLKYATIIQLKGEQFGKLGVPISKLHKIEDEK